MSLLLTHSDNHFLHGFHILNNSRDCHTFKKVHACKFAGRLHLYCQNHDYTQYSQRFDVTIFLN